MTKTRQEQWSPMEKRADPTLQIQSSENPVSSFEKFFSPPPKRTESGYANSSQYIELFSF